MDKNLQDIEDLFYSNLEGNEEMPSEKVWDAVDKRLDKETVISIKRKYTNLKRVSVLLLLLLISFVLFEVNTTYNSKEVAGRNGDKADRKTDTVVQSNTEPKEESFVNSKNVNKTTGINDDTKEVIPGNSLIAVENNNTLLSQKIKQPADKKQFPENNILQTKVSGKNSMRNPPDITITSGRRKKLTAKSRYKVIIKNATATADDKELLANNNDINAASVQKQKNTVTENLKPDKPDSTAAEKAPKSDVLVKIKVADTSTKAIAKTDKKKPGKSSKFSFTPFFSPDIAWYRLQDDKVSSNSDNASELEGEEKHEFSYTYGMLVDYKIDKHWGLQSGITLSNTNIVMEPKTIYAQPDNTGSIKYRINTSSGYGFVLPSFSASPVIGDSLYAFTSTHSLQYIAIPLAATYNFTRGKFKFNALAGLSANILTRAKLETNVEKGFDNSLETVNNIQGLKKMYVSGLAGVGVDYKLTKKISLTFAPTIRFALNSINQDAAVKSYPMSLGFVAGLKIGL